MPSPIIDIQTLKDLSGSKDLILFDASGGPTARSNFEKEHLQGATFVDLETQLADVKENAAEGGRHPLPSIDDFAVVLGQLSVSLESHVVVYDDKAGGNAAARLWWMLKAIGHEKVQVLDGGLKAAQKAGYPMSSGDSTTASPKSPYPAKQWSLPLADIDEVAAAATSTDRTVIDVRSGPRYAGEVEPIDLIAGHIPGAINIPFEENLNDDGQFLPAEVLREKYAGVLSQGTTGDVIVHCGSGVTACHTLLAMEYAGLGIPKLYVGSWSEWSRNDRPMITKAD